jgi:hypothetical protein
VLKYDSWNPTLCIEQTANVSLRFSSGRITKVRKNEGSRSMQYLVQMKMVPLDRQSAAFVQQSATRWCPSSSDDGWRKIRKIFSPTQSFATSTQGVCAR